ncbi:MAG: pseudouridine synthase [Lachnospiraceae bacterium]|nr:pseudouridine synthase [Lachnospiraceae bacterium]
MSEKMDKAQPKTADEAMRLNKFLSVSGLCSRRQADRLIEEGRVTIDGRIAEMGEKVLPSMEVAVDGKLISQKPKKVILAVNKPRGIVCTTSKKEKDNIVDYLNYPERIYPAGRLDKDSEGLILMTNDGELMNEILRARNYHEKEYVVEVNKPIRKDFLMRMSSGVYLEDLEQMTRPCQVTRTGRFAFHIVLTQGLNRQIRRMCEALGYRVESLKRIRIMNIELGDLETGKYRKLTKKELQGLCQLTGMRLEELDG